MSWIDYISPGAAAVAAIFAAVQLYLSRREHQREFEWRRNDRAFSYSVFKNPEYRASRDFIKNKFGSLAGMRKAIPLDQIDSLKQDCPELTFHIFTCISHWGRLSTEIRLGLVSEDVAFEIHSAALTDVYVAFESFIDRRLKADPRSYPDLKGVGERWVVRRLAYLDGAPSS